MITAVCNFHKALTTRTVLPSIRAGDFSQKFISRSGPGAWRVIMVSGLAFGAGIAVTDWALCLAASDGVRGNECGAGRLKAVDAVGCVPFD